MVRRIHIKPNVGILWSIGYMQDQILHVDPNQNMPGYCNKKPLICEGLDSKLKSREGQYYSVGAYSHGFSTAPSR